MPNKVTDEERKNILADFNAGESGASLARKYNRARDTIYEICGPCKKRPSKISKEKHTNVLADFKSGLTKTEIAAKHNLAKSTITRICGVTRPIKGRDSVALAALALEKANEPDKPSTLQKMIAELVEVLRKEGVSSFTIQLGTEVTCTLNMKFRG
jgi:Mor family transcriptional regulator